MAKEILSVRDVDEETWRKFRAKVAEEGLRTGKALDEAMRIWIEEKKKMPKRDPRNFLKVKGFIKTRGTVSWSEEIDQTLYGAQE